MMPEILVLPGWSNSGPTHWQTLWEQANPDMERVLLGNWEKPLLADWLAVLDKRIRACSEPPVLLAHSLACVLVAQWAAQTNGRDGEGAAGRLVRAAMLVAPADVDSPAHSPDDVRNFSPIPQRPFGFPALVVGSQDDPYMTGERARDLAGKWGADFIDAGAKGHINAESGLGDWPEGLAWLRDLMSRAE